MSEHPALIGRYHVQRQLGEGGMGVLYLATDPLLDRHVALKLLRVDSVDLRRRFVREAQSAARIQHPNIVTVYDVGDHDGQLYIAMEYIDGDTLATLIRDDAPFSVIRKLDIIDDIADGLGFAHQRGIVHRDIKPANLMITRSGLVKVLDFGIARIAHKQSGHIDGPTLIGTPAYMAPEQLEGAEADARSDIYAVGLVMYELFSGRRAFAGATTADVLELVLAARPTPLEQLVPDIDPDLARVVARAMARRPEDRYPDLQAMRKDLASSRRRAMQASADDATVVVATPASGAIPVVAASAGRAAADRVAAAVPAPVSVPPAAPAGISTSEDVVLERLAAGRGKSTRPLTHADLGDTIFAPLSSTEAPPPLPGAVVPEAAPARPAPVDDGPLPVPLPAVPASALTAAAQHAAGGATVDAVPVRDAPEAPATARSTSPPRVAGASVPAPLAPAPLVSAPGAQTTTPLPTTRKGVPAMLIVGALIVLLGVSLLAALVAVRSLGLLSGPPLLARVGGLFTTTDDPKAADPGDTAGQSAPVTAGEREPPQVPPAAAAASTDPVAPAAATPAKDATAMAPPAALPPSVDERSLPAVVAPAEARASSLPQPARPDARAGTGRPAAVRPSAASTGPVRPRTAPQGGATAVPAGVTARDALPRERGERVATELPAAPRDEPLRREPDPAPTDIAPDEEALEVVRGYVAARNTSHASGIRRVWPSVDDLHLRRITSAFSAPLTLSTCDVAAAGAGRATAKCLLTQPGTTGAYASGHALTIRRTFVFDLVRQGRAWVIVGLRE